mmetsp:Transcript_15299/g.25847  ORF Transcript_15299/g.25847 Transcript_15299/m.25847 type:complete len:222 (+) Transcript_15299:106-771(+)|eukprot:CAMPEP_0198222864 /NCGR_PEP_ID=MMETSP1445-20131203/90024_1 /TAXON_ID=36898 /ORGANISM="Pyramimonas sp., Strain CCMP2087" /LENGTH=221 /DNA_ID=CAMNT_0043901525 /DNA_START=83 /DNA_END=748 /DNA_ORIENTATION=+
MEYFTVSLGYTNSEGTATTVGAELDKKHFDELLRTGAFLQCEKLRDFKRSYAQQQEFSENPPPKRRGRPPGTFRDTAAKSPRSEDADAGPRRPRGRPPKPKDESTDEPESLQKMTPYDDLQLAKKRGRPPKAKDSKDPGQDVEDDDSKPKRPRGRPPKAKDDSIDTTPGGSKRGRGRPPKAQTSDEPGSVKRGRGRPPKAKAEEESTDPTEESTAPATVEI